jgi:ubiquinone/menaquinone biosynthesis C-methylase UbiE
VREVKTVLDHAQSIGVTVDIHGNALDFGCGAGRLTQALAANFARAVGVDISLIMIELAEKHNSFPASSQYIASGSDSLPLGDGTFSFVYSSIALQHIQPSVAERYIAELLRVLKPGGTLVFQVADGCKGQYFRQMIGAIRVRLRRLLESAGLLGGHMQVLYLNQKRVRRVLSDNKGEIRDVQYTNSLTQAFNGELRYSSIEPETGLVSKQYYVVKTC